MNFGSWYVRTGRIAPRTFWLHYFLPLAGLVVLALAADAAVVLSQLDEAAANANGGSFRASSSIFSGAVLLVTIVPQLSSMVARLHDRGHSAWWLLFSLLPIVGAIVLLVQAALPGDEGPNRYGPEPDVPVPGPVSA